MADKNREAQEKGKNWCSCFCPRDEHSESEEEERRDVVIPSDTICAPTSKPRPVRGPRADIQSYDPRKAKDTSASTSNGGTVRELDRAQSVPELTKPRDRMNRSEAGPLSPTSDASFPDQGVVYEVLGLQYIRGTLKGDPKAKGEAHLIKVEEMARTERARILEILSGTSDTVPNSVEEVTSVMQVEDLSDLNLGRGPTFHDVSGNVSHEATGPVDVAALLKVTLVLGDVLQLRGQINEAADVLADTLQRFADIEHCTPLRITAAEDLDSQEVFVRMRLEAAAHHRLGSLRRIQESFQDAEVHLRAASELLGVCARLGDSKANADKAQTLAVLASILLKVGRETEAAAVEFEGMTLAAELESES